MKAASGEQRVTIYEIAKRAGCSAMTVSRALMAKTKSNDRINPETRQNIRRLAKEMGYRPNSAARGLILRKTFNVGFHINQKFSYYNPLFYPILRTMQSDLEDGGYHLGFYYFEKGNIPELTGFLKPPRLVDVLVALGRNLSAEEQQTVIDSGIPRVSLFAPLPDFRSLVIDDDLGGRLAARFLHERGFREVTMIVRYTPSRLWDERITGFADEARRLGMKATEIDGFHNPLYDLPYAWNHGKVAPDLWERLQARGVAGRCIYCNSDSFAVGLLNDFQARGLRVGKDVSILGYDNAEELEQSAEGHSAPRLTTIYRPRVEIGRRAAQIVTDEDWAAGHESFAPSLVVRESVGFAAS